MRDSCATCASPTLRHASLHRVAGVTALRMIIAGAIGAETRIPLNYNFNGMASPSEIVDPVTPDGAGTHSASRR